MMTMMMMMMAKRDVAMKMLMGICGCCELPLTENLTAALTSNSLQGTSLSKTRKAEWDIAIVVDSSRCRCRNGIQ